MSIIEPVEAWSGWRCIDTEHTAVFPPGHEPEREIVRAIREFDPQYVPIWCRKMYVTPTKGVVIYGYHVIGRHIPVPAEDPWTAGRRPARLVARPTYGWKYTDGSIYERRMWADPPKRGTQAWKEQWPPLYRQHDWRLYLWMRQAYWMMFQSAENIKRVALESEKAEYEAGKRAVEKVELERKLSLRDDRHMVVRAIERGDIYLQPDPDPKPFAQAEKVWTGDAA